MTIKNPFDLKGELDIAASYQGPPPPTTLPFPIDSSGNSTITKEFPWNSFKYIMIFFEVEYRLMTDTIIRFPKVGGGKFGFSARWLASFTDGDLELTQDGAQPKIYGTNKSDGEIVVAANARLDQSKREAKTPYVEMVVNLVAGDEDSGIQVGFQRGSFSAGTSVGGSKGSGAREFTYRLNLDMARPDIPAQVVVDKIPHSLLEPAPILFKEDEDTLSSQSTRELHDWVSKVKDHQYLGAVIALGTVPIDIQAFASTTGDAKYNKGETDRRLDSVKKILKSSQFFSSSTLKFNAKSHGMEKAEGKGAKYGFNRRVEIKIDHNKAKQAGERFLGAK